MPDSVIYDSIYYLVILLLYSYTRVQAVAIDIFFNISIFTVSKMVILHVSEFSSHIDLKFPIRDSNLKEHSETYQGHIGLRNVQIMFRYVGVKV